jgi:hypothetical protein
MGWYLSFFKKNDIHHTQSPKKWFGDFSHLNDYEALNCSNSFYS